MNAARCHLEQASSYLQDLNVSRRLVGLIEELQPQSAYRGWRGQAAVLDGLDLRHDFKEAVRSRRCDGVGCLCGRISHSAWSRIGFVIIRERILMIKKLC